MFYAQSTVTVISEQDGGEMERDMDGQIRSKRIKGPKELYLSGQKHSLQIFGVIPFVRLQNDSETTVKRWKIVKNGLKS